MQIAAFKQQSSPLINHGDKENQTLCHRLINALSPNVPTFLHAGFSADIGLDMLVQTLIAPGNTSAAFIHYVMSMAPVDIHTTEYRKEIADELIEKKEMVSQLEKISVMLHKVEKLSMSWRYEVDNSLREMRINLEPLQFLIQDVKMLQNYVQAINNLEEALRDSTSVGLRRLHKYANDVKATAEFKAIEYALDCYHNAATAEFRVTLSSDHKVTNLIFLPPKEQEQAEKRDVTLWQTICDYFSAGWRKLFKRKEEKKKKDEQLSMEKVLKGMFRDVFLNMCNHLTGKPDTYYTLMVKAFDALIAVSREQISATTLIEGDIDYHVSAVRFYDFLVENKLPATRAELLPKEERIHQINGMRNPLINLQAISSGCHIKYAAGNIVPNDFYANPDSNMIILSGPNGGGKSRFVTSVGIMYILAQNGFHVPADCFRAGMVDNICTQFVHPDDFGGDGRWKEEAKRALQNVMYKATPYSLCILDDFGSGTSYEEAREPALNLLYGLRRIGCVTLMNTHIHDLAKDIESGEFPNAKNRRMELVVQPDTDIVPTYKIVDGRAGKSYAAEIAAGLGLSRKNIDQSIAERIESGELPAHLIRS
jgi:hypothetical protein